MARIESIAAFGGRGGRRGAASIDNCRTALLHGLDERTF